MGRRFDADMFFKACLIVFFLLGIVALVAGVMTKEARASRSLFPSLSAPLSARELPVTQNLTITPGEIDLGHIGPGGTRRGAVVLKPPPSGVAGWSLVAPSGWTQAEEKILRNVQTKVEETLRLQLRIVNGGIRESVNNGKARYSAQLLIEAGDSFTELTREIAVGNYREQIDIATAEDQKSFHIVFRVVDETTPSQIGVDPLHLDFGTLVLGERAGRRVKVVNEGWGTLKWQAAAVKSSNLVKDSEAEVSRYISFLNEETAGSKQQYREPRHLKERLELQGQWQEDRGYPAAASDGQTLRYAFSGTGISVYFWKGPTVGQLTAFMNNRFIYQQEGYAEQKERFEWSVVGGLPDGAHVLTLINRNGPVSIEGVRIYGSGSMRLQPGHIAISPDHGSITRQTNFVNVTVNTKNLSPGQYAGQLIFDSNGGKKEIELSLEVVADNTPKTLDVYRFVNGLDYFLTTNPQAEAAVLSARGYTKQGIAFRLFNPGTPGTTEFYRWFNAQKGDHFYAYEPKSAKFSLQGYVLEGAIGNIATSRLPQTRELYRWRHPAQGHHFYTTDPKGEGAQKRGYRYDGIAGYVRP